MRNLFLVLVVMCSCLIACKKISEEQKTSYLSQPSHAKLEQSTLKQSMERGAIIYQDFCKQCHQPDGLGIAKTFPPLASADYLINNREESIRAVKYGQKGKITVNGIVYNGVMSPLGLSDDEVADVMNYIMNSWGNSQNEMVSEEEVALVKK